MDADHRSNSDELALAKFFWEEYKYRHDLIWQRILLSTTAIVVMSTIPYLQKGVALVLKDWILIAPGLALSLDVFMLLVMRNELDLFWKIKEAYRRYQNSLLDKDLQHSLNKVSDFKMFVLAYYVSLGLLAIGNSLIIYLVWLPGVLHSFSGCL